MRSRSCLAIALLLPACSPDRPMEGAAETLPAAGMASAPAAADSTASSRRARVIPLAPMTGDVELLHGDPDRAGEPFVMRIRELPGTRIPPHSHPVDEHITVVQGTWYFAIGERWDSTALRELTPGSYAFAPAGSTMFGYSPDGAVVQVHGTGPFHIRWRNGATTLDDAAGATTFRFRKSDRVQTPRGAGTIRQGYASGAIVQYEILADGGTLFMADEAALRRP